MRAFRRSPVGPGLLLLIDPPLRVPPAGFLCSNPLHALQPDELFQDKARSHLRAQHPERLPAVCPRKGHTESLVFSPSCLTLVTGTISPVSVSCSPCCGDPNALPFSEHALCSPGLTYADAGQRHLLPLCVPSSSSGTPEPLCTPLPNAQAEDSLAF